MIWNIKLVGLLHQVAMSHCAKKKTKKPETAQPFCSVFTLHINALLYISFSLDRHVNIIVISKLQSV